MLFLGMLYYTCFPGNSHAWFAAALLRFYRSFVAEFFPGGKKLNKALCRKKQCRKKLLTPET